MAAEIQHGWYSATQAEQHGSSIYLTPKGQEVEVSMVSPSKDKGPGEAYSHDVEYAGEVTDWVRKAQQGSSLVSFYQAEIPFPPVGFYPVKLT